VSNTTITVNQSQKEALIQFRSVVESKTSEDVTQGEAVSIAAELASDHIRECLREDEEMGINDE